MPERDNGATAGRDQNAVRTRSEELRKELSIADLAFAQILFIVGLQWVGVAAKQGPAHVIFWLIAIALFYMPSAVGAADHPRGEPHALRDQDCRTDRRDEPRRGGSLCVGATPGAC